MIKVFYMDRGGDCQLPSTQNMPLSKRQPGAAIAVRVVPSALK